MTYICIILDEILINEHFNKKKELELSIFLNQVAIIGSVNFCIFQIQDDDT